MTQDSDRDSAARLCSPSVPEPDAWAVTIGPAGNSSVYEAFAAHQKDEAESLARECLFGDSSRPLPLKPLYLAPQWVSAGSVKPPPRFEVLLTDGENVFTGIWSGQQWETHGEDGYNFACGVTHWMPLPEPPC